MSASVGSVLGDYRLEAVLGASPTAVVYRAAHVRLGSPAAVKVLAPVAGEDEQARERFLRRVTATAQIDHPSVVPILDAGVHGDEPYVVMRHVAGGDLKALLARTGALDPGLALTILEPVGEALDAAHARGVVHGGVKPSNVLLRWSRDGAVQQVYLSDFGMAERAPSAEGLSSVGPLLDRFDYLAPEQVEDGEVGPPADVYALGCVLFHALTGRAPFGGRFGGAVLHGRAGVERPSALRPGLPADVDDPILRAMEEEPRRRFAAAGDLMRSVGAALDGAGRPAASHTLPSAARGTTTDLEPAPAPERTEADLPPVPEPNRTVDSPVVTEADPAPPPAARAPSEPAPEPEPVAAAAPADDDAPRRRRRLLTVTVPVVVGTLLAGVLGFVVASDPGDDGGGGAPTATGSAAGAGGGGGTGATAPLRAIADRRLSDMRCTVSDGGAGDVAGTASCTPQGGAGDRPQRVSLTLLASREALDAFFRRSRALTAGGGSESAGAGCPQGRWTSAGGGAGRVFCPTGTPRVVWTVDEALVLADAGGPRQAPLVAWWQQHRDLRPEGRQG